MAQPSTPTSILSSLANAYKELFPDLRLKQLAEMDRDLFKWLGKKDDLVGYASSGGYYYIPVRYGMPQGLGAQFTVAQGAGTAGLVKRFALSRKRYYGYITLDDETVRAARDRSGAFYDVKEAEIEDLVKQVSMELEKHLWGDGGGSLGRISSITNANPSVITLTNAADAANFHVGQVLGANDANKTLSGGTDRGGEEAVTKVDLDAGTVTMTSNVVADHSWAANDYLFRNAGDSTNGDGDNVVTGLEGWIPLTAETSGTFLGVSRLDDVVRLQGSRQSYLGSIEETIKKLASKMRRIGAMYDSIWLSHNNWHRLEVELGSRAIREDASDSPFGMSALKYASPDGVKRIMAGAFCPDDRGYLLNKSSWTLHHMDPVPHIVTTDGLRMARLTAADGVEVRVRMWVELGCASPKDNGVFGIS